MSSPTQCVNLLFSAETGSIDEACCKSAVSTLLGVAIPLGALGLKLPQVCYIVVIWFGC
jgi:hypothetical protein